MRLLIGWCVPRHSRYPQISSTSSVGEFVLFTFGILGTVEYYTRGKSRTYGQSLEEWFCMTKFWFAAGQEFSSEPSWTIIIPDSREKAEIEPNHNGEVKKAEKPYKSHFISRVPAQNPHATLASQTTTEKA